MGKKAVFLEHGVAISVTSGQVLEIISLGGHQSSFSDSVRMLQKPSSFEETGCDVNVMFLGSRYGKSLHRHL